MSSNEVEKILTAKNISYSPSGDNKVLIRCINPDHEDKHPSMLVNTISGWAKCLSCGHSANILHKAGKRQRKIEVQREKLRNSISNVIKMSEEVNFPDEIEMWTSDYRGISAKTLKEYQAFQWGAHPKHLFFPLKKISGSIYNFIGRIMDPTITTNKYTLAYSKPTELFPAPKLNSANSIILVEGIFDALNLIDKGITNVSAIFGVNFNESHIEYINMLGAEEIITMFDGDEAGQNAAEKISRLCDLHFLGHRNVKLPTGKDPGSLTKSEIDLLKEKLYG